MSTQPRTPLDLNGLLSQHYFDVKDFSSTHFGTDGDGNDLFLVMIRAAPLDPAGGEEDYPPKTTESAAKATKKDEDFSDEVKDLIAAHPLGLMLDGKDRASGVSNPGAGRHRRRKKKNEARVPRNLAAEAIDGQGDAVSTDDELDLIAEFARLVHARLHP